MLPPKRILKRVCKTMNYTVNIAHSCYALPYRHTYNLEIGKSRRISSEIQIIVANTDYCRSHLVFILLFCLAIVNNIDSQNDNYKDRHGRCNNLLG